MPKRKNQLSVDAGSHERWSSWPIEVFLRPVDVRAQISTFYCVVSTLFSMFMPRACSLDAAYAASFAAVQITVGRPPPTTGQGCFKAAGVIFESKTIILWGKKETSNSVSQMDFYENMCITEVQKMVTLSLVGCDHFSQLFHCFSLFFQGALPKRLLLHRKRALKGAPRRYRQKKLKTEIALACIFCDFG